MAEAQTIARPYAEAAFKLASEQGDLAAWSDALGRLATVASDATARELIGSPNLTADQIASLFTDTAGQMTDAQRSFVRVLAQADRLGVMSEIAELFEQLRNRAEGVLDAQVRSAFPLSDVQIADINAVLRAKYGKDVKVSVEVAPELIGGVTIQIGDEVLDASVRGKLATMVTALTH